MKCMDCKNRSALPNETCALCYNCDRYERKPLTNADRIRAMTDEELAQLFADDNCGYCRIHDFCFAKGCRNNCEDVWLDWLKQEAVSDG